MHSEPRLNDARRPESVPVPHRTFFDDAGRVWRVHPAGAGSRNSSLVFESHDIIRRVRSYPDDWTELPDDELLALSLRW